MKFVSVVHPCYNEADNVREMYRTVKEIFSGLPGYRYEQIFIDNASTDGTVDILKEIAKGDRNLRIIVNARNFGQNRSPYYGLLQAQGECVILLASDFQDPPGLIPQFLQAWEEGAKIAMAIRRQAEESLFMRFSRSAYYWLIRHFSDEIEQVRNFTGFGLYDRQVVEALKQVKDPNPYLRGLVSEIGFARAMVPFDRPPRTRGRSSNNFYTLYDIAMLGFVNYSKVPLRLASFLGFSVSLLSLLIAVGYLVYKIIFWERFQLGMAPLVIGLFFFSSVQLFFIGVIGEYLVAIHTQVKNRPLVIETERVNFDRTP
jgi:glycosyltransferase involved in cell wall biosynthesis